MGGSRCLFISSHILYFPPPTTTSRRQAAQPTEKEKNYLIIFPPLFGYVGNLAHYTSSWVVLSSRQQCQIPATTKRVLISSLDTFVGCFGELCFGELIDVPLVIPNQGELSSYYCVWKPRLTPSNWVAWTVCSKALTHICYLEAWWSVQLVSHLEGRF